MLLNIIWNSLGRILVTASTYLATPFLIKIYGIDSFGIISLSLILYTVLAGLDFGITQSLNRYTAGAKSNIDSLEVVSKLMSVLQVLYLIILIIFLLNIKYINLFILDSWLNLSNHPQKVIYLNSIFFMILGISFRWLAGIYRAVLFGSEKHFIVNLADIVSIFLAFFGPILLNLFVEINLSFFFLIQASIWILYFLIIFFITQREMKRIGMKFTLIYKGKFPISYLSKVSVIAIFTVFLANLDKLYVSNYLPIEEFSIYSLSALFGASIILFISPIITSMLPRAANFWIRNDTESFENLFFDFSKGILIFSAPLVIFLFYNSEIILKIWLQGNAKKISLDLVTIMLLASFFSGLSYTSNAVQLTSGRTNITLLLLSISLVLFFGTVDMAFNLDGSRGIALIWLSINFLYFIISYFYTTLLILNNKKFSFELVCFSLYYLSFLVILLLILDFLIDYTLKNYLVYQPLKLFFSFFLLAIVTLKFNSKWLKFFLKRYNKNYGEYLSQYKK